MGIPENTTVDVEEPQQTGKSNTQHAEPVDAILESRSGDSSDSRLSSLLAHRPDTGIRGQAALDLLRHSIQLTENRASVAEIESKALTTKLESIRNDEQVAREDNVRLRERLKSVGQTGLLGNVLITLGALVVGAAAPELREHATTQVIVVAIIGCMLMIIGWFSGIVATRYNKD